MIHQIANQLQDFEFHDAWLTLDRFSGGDLTVNAEHVNVHKAAGYGDFAHDMELDGAKMIFQGFHAATFEPGRTWKTDADGKAYSDDPLVILEDGDAEALIVKELQNGISVYVLGTMAESRYYIEGCGIEPFFTMEFSADNVVVTWDGYRKKAWYELHRQSWREAVLVTPEGKWPVTAHIICHDEDVYDQGRLEQAPQVRAGIKYGGRDLWGRGRDEATAFAELQKLLPEHVVLLPVQSNS